jgi:DNA invertase Pin-like site-specific DNA recombinase
MAIIGYARISDKSQKIRSQVEQLGEYGCETIIEETVTGVSEEKKLYELLEELDKGDTIVVTRADRLGRSTVQILLFAEKLKERDINLVIMDFGIDTRTPTGKLMLGMMSQFAEFEREQLRVKQRAGIESAKKRGVHLGRKRAWSAHDLSVAFTLFQNGATVRDIENETKIPKSSLYAELKKQGITR